MFGYDLGQRSLLLAAQATDTPADKRRRSVGLLIVSCGQTATWKNLIQTDVVWARVGDCDGKSVRAVVCMLTKAHGCLT